METYHGHIKTRQDALLVFEACRLGVLQRQHRRLAEKERSAVRSGAVFVWDEKEAGMRRWTDGKHWSPSRVHGSFLSYRELDSKRSLLASSDPSQPDDKHYQSQQTSFKSDGLIKQSYSITTADQRRLHLICYYSRRDVLNNRLQVPTRDSRLAGITIPPGYYLDTGEAPATKSSPTVHVAGHQRKSSLTMTPSSSSASSSSASSSSSSVALSAANAAAATAPLFTSPAPPFPMSHPSPMHHPPRSMTYPPPRSPPLMTLSPSSSSEDDERHSTVYPSGLEALSAATALLTSTPTATSAFTSPTSTSLVPSTPSATRIAAPVAYHSPVPIHIPPLLNTGGKTNELIPQDIPWSRAKNSEDARQLNAIYSELRL
ncbi:uncharacterized protein VTP21DRAFT_9736 [Calcarisporiella thermophila]|uniref:uncharacterized protein n=1 Tax=Calcarisporiella thermophila TaxID=911321 RepID=UPI00374419CE